MACTKTSEQNVEEIKKKAQLLATPFYFFINQFINYNKKKKK